MNDQIILSLKEKLEKWKENLSLKEIKSTINFIKDPISKLIAEKLLLENNK